MGSENGEQETTVPPIRSAHKAIGTALIGIRLSAEQFTVRSSLGYSELSTVDCERRCYLF